MHRIKKHLLDCNNCSTNNCFVKHCLADWIPIINLGKNCVTYKKGQIIFSENAPIFGIYFVKKGRVKIISTGVKGKMQIVRLAGEGHVLGHRGNKNELYPIGAVALDDSEICFINNDIMYDVFISNPEFTYSLMMFYSIELRKSEIRSKYLAEMNCQEKVVAALLYLQDVYGARADGTLNAKLSTKEVSQIAAISPEQVSRQLSLLKKQKFIFTDRNKIVLNQPEKLREIVGRHGLIF